MVKRDHDRSARKAFVLRFPEELHRELSEKARNSDRSLNGEINYRLRQSLREHADWATV
jgi:predicted HicB family RNase H-like nuclease